MEFGVAEHSKNLLLFLTVTDNGGTDSMVRFDKRRKIKVLVELEKMRNIDFNLLWDYLNAEILEVKSIDDKEFVRADEFFEHLDKLANARSGLNMELIKD